MRGNWSIEAIAMLHPSSRGSWYNPAQHGISHRALTISSAIASLSHSTATHHSISSTCSFHEMFFFRLPSTSSRIQSMYRPITPTPIPMIPNVTVVMSSADISMIARCALSVATSYAWLCSKSLTVSAMKLAETRCLGCRWRQKPIW